MLRHDPSSALSFALLGALVALFASACSGTDREQSRIISRCSPGRSDSCTCTDGRTGAQLCLDDHTFGPCECTGPLPFPDASELPADSGIPDPDSGAQSFPDATHTTDDDSGVTEPADTGVEPEDAGTTSPDAATTFPDATTTFPDAAPNDTGVRDTGVRDGGTAPGCTLDNECSPPATICESGACVPGCNAAGGATCTSGSCGLFSGRCGGQFCIFDSMCSPPNTVCESQQCVLSCVTAGCTGGDVCDTSDGRCVASCTTDAQCSPPSTTCQNGGCLPGCNNVAGPQCSAPDICDTNTGHCGPCSTDAQCGPPDHICVSGACLPGCTEPGGASCIGSNFCQHDNGRCEPAGTGLLGASCMRNNDCASSECRSYPGGLLCVSACGTNRDCPSAFSCVDNNGARICIPANRVSMATFVDAAGATCTTHGECQSNFCAGGVCVDTCAEDGDCMGGTCRFYSHVMDDFVGACNGPQGNIANGAACTASTDCRSGVCVGTTCSELCTSTNDCDAGRTCQLVDFSVCLQEIFGICLVYNQNFTTACVTHTRGPGNVGAACTVAADCQSQLCHVALNRCTDTCARNSDCPSNDRCKTIEYGTAGQLQTIDLNACVPRGF